MKRGRHGTGERGEMKEEERVGTNRLGPSAILLAARAGQVSRSCPQEAWKRQSRLHRENEWFDVGVEPRYGFSASDRTWTSGTGSGTDLGVGSKRSTSKVGASGG